MHPGYIVVILLITLYLLGEGVRCLISRDYKGSIFKGLLMIWVLTVIFSMLNPNGLNIFINMISTRLFTKDTMHVVEMLPTFHLYAIKMIPIDYSYIAFLSFSLLSLRYFKKIGVVHMLLLIVFIIMSLVAYRYIIFYMSIAAPIVARIIINLSKEKGFGKLIKVLKAKENSLFLIASIIGVVLVLNASISLAGFKLKENDFFAFPKGAADFLSNVKIKGNMFNEYGFGGYLIWRLYPEKMVFIDTRSLEPDVTFEYKVVAFALERTYLSWKDILKKYNISYVVTRPLWQNGKIIPIVEKLLDSTDWVLIYSDHLSLIFLQNDPENLSIIKRYSIEKQEGFNTIIAQASGWAMTANKINPNYFITLGKIFFKMGKLNDAEKAFVMAYEIDPDNSTVKEWLHKLREDKHEIDKGEAL